MIPKIIHYCWFGGKPLPKSAIKCINSWKIHFPDYEIKEWNESNFDISLMPYTSEAYAMGKFAFVSDVARFYIIYQEGGLYFDTDVEVVAPMYDIVETGAFMGIQNPAIEGEKFPMVAPGLGLGAEAGHPFYKEVLDYYKNLHYSVEDGITKSGNIVDHITYLLKGKGLKPTNSIQKVADLTIYPKDYFCPFDDNTGVLATTQNTRSIHWYSKTWIDKPKWYFIITRFLHRHLGVNSLYHIKKTLKRK